MLSIRQPRRTTFSTYLIVCTVFVQRTTFNINNMFENMTDLGILTLFLSHTIAKLTCVIKKQAAVN